MRDFKIGLGCGVSHGISPAILEAALAGGVRYFDTSSFYSVGAINQFDDILQKLGISRDSVHLSLKLWVTELGHNRVNDYNSDDISLWGIYEGIRQKFGVGRFDSVVLHWPLKTDAEGYPDEFRIEEIWPQMEQLLELKIISGIGVSNFNIVEMQRLLNIARIKPFSAQIEFNPFAYDQNLAAFCQGQGIKVIGHSPFGFGWSNGHLALFETPVLMAMSEKYQLPVPQLVLSWIMAKGVVPIPGTTKLEHLQGIIAATQVDVLTPEDAAAIDALNQKAFHYLGLYDYFGMSFHQRYFANPESLSAMIYKPDGNYDHVSIYNAEFMSRVKEALTEGPGFVILPSHFEQNVRGLQAKLASEDVGQTGRWDGVGPNNGGPDMLAMIDDPALSLVVEALLGWDCKLDNISLSTSRVAPDNAVFGPHQDSPFDNNPGAPLPPPSYPVVLQIIFALDEFTEDNGPLYVIPYSHKKRQRVNLPWQGGLKHNVIPEGAVKAIVPKGSAIIAVGHIWHGSFQNMTESPRMGLLIEFVCSICDARDKFTLSTVQQHVVETCSRRMIRLFNNGKLHQHSAPELLNAFKEARKNRIPDFAKPRGAGSQDPQYGRDVDLWLTEVERNPEDARSVSLLAASYFDSGDFVNARKWYARRAEMGGGDPEVYFAMCRVAEALSSQGAPWLEVQEAYLRAWEFRPARAEPLYDIACRYRVDQRYRLGYLFAKSAAEIPLPEEDILDVRSDIYAWRATDEQAVCASWIDQHAEAFTLCRRLLARPDIPDGDRQRIAGNRDISVPAMIDAASSYPEVVVRRLLAGPGEAEVVVSLVAGSDRETTEQTLNSFVRCCTDVWRVGCFLVVDAGLSTADRAMLGERYGFLEFAPPGPADVPDGLGARLAQLRAQIRGRIWLHLGQGWRFFAPENLITRLTAVLEAEPQVFQVGINFADAVKLTGASAAERAVRRAPDAGRYVLTDGVASGPAMFDTARLDRAGGVECIDPDAIADLGRRAVAAGLQTASLDEVLCITAV